MTRALSVADLTAYHESCRMRRKPLVSPFHLHCRVASKTSSRGNSMNDFRQTAALQTREASAAPTVRDLAGLLAALHARAAERDLAGGPAAPAPQWIAAASLLT